MPNLPRKFWNRHPTIVAAELIGCFLHVRQGDGSILSGRIVETEAYHEDEEACHAFGFSNRKKSDRVAHFFESPGVTYVYLNYGIHHLLNVITGPDNDGSAVLIRAIEPSDDVDVMRKNRGPVGDKNLTNGPGKLTKALGIDLAHNKINLFDSDAPISFGKRSSRKAIQLVRGPRVGISKATEHLWRFAEKDNPHISKAKENKLFEPFDVGSLND